jgi:pimeloyl-ACP methyl ester carboxylesterase
VDVQLGETTIAVRDTGTGTPVLLVHGWPDSGELWRLQVPALTGAGYRVIAPDLRGFGGSSKPAGIDAYGIRAHVGDLVGTLDTLGVGRAHLVGHDWGAAIAWTAAAVRPDRFASLTALSVGHPGAFASAGMAQKARSWYMLLFQFPEIAERWLSDDGFARLREWSAHPGVDEVVGRLSDPGALTASLGIYRANMPPRSFIGPPPQLPPVAVPVMGIWSDGDFALTERQMTGSGAYTAAGWRYERVEGAGHWIPLDAPERLNALLLDFLATQP